MRHKHAGYGSIAYWTVLLFYAFASLGNYSYAFEPDAEILFPERKGPPMREYDGDDDVEHLMNSTERIVSVSSQGIRGEAASLLFNDRHLSGGNDCGGVCVHPNTCTRLGGSVRGGCARSGGLCCIFDRTCNQVSKELTSYFHSPGYPGPTVGTLVCQHDIIVLPGVCGIRLEFKEFNTTRPLDRGLCNIDQFLILNSLDGAAFPRCGELTGYATIVPVDSKYKIPLSLLSIIQSSRETFKWNIRVTQMKCDATRRIRDYPGCGKKFAAGDATNFPGLNKEVEPIDNNGIGNGESASPSRQRRQEDDISSSYIDNAFYIEYLKQTHQAVYDGPSPNPNQTLCKNTAVDILKEKLQAAGTTVKPALDKSARILRGMPALKFEFPWQVSIQDAKGHVCGGAILNEYSIVTASHCFMSIYPVQLKYIKVVLGDLNLNLTTDTEHMEAEIHSVLFHSHFDPYYLKNDIAVIRVRRPIMFRPGIQPVCLPESGNCYEKDEAWISGWGAINYPRGILANHLQKVSNEIIANAECKRILKIDYIFPSMMCAVAPKCSGTCFGDSGGPLVVENGDVSRLVGIVSFGIGGCALLPYWPDVYTRVTSYTEWLSYATTWF